MNRASSAPAAEAADAAGDLAPDEVIPAALAAGALAPADVVHHGVLVEQVGRSHPVYRVRVGGEVRFFVKSFGPRRGATDGLAARERAVLALAEARPAVAALTPAPWPWTDPPASAGVKRRVVVATAAVRGAEAWTMDRLGGGDRTPAQAWAELVDALAPPVAAFHRATRDLAKPGSHVPRALESEEPWGLRLMDGDAAPELWATPATAAMLREAAADALLVQTLREARALWRPMALIHADLKHDNVLIERTTDALRVRILDWEMARIGDPAWDLAGLAARLAVVRREGPPWQEEDIANVARLVRAYAAASGLSPAPLAHRLTHYAATVLLMMALQHASTLPPGSDAAEAHTLLLKARSTFRRAQSLTAGIIARVEPASA